MAQNLFLRIASEFQSKGFDDLNNSLRQTQQQVGQAASSTTGLASSLNTLKSVFAGAILAAPLAGFVKEAIDSEAATARLNAQLSVFKQSISSVQIDQLTTQVRNLAGVTQTELVNALGTGLRFFKDTSKELGLLNTAIGITKVTGVSLATAFDQLGLVQLGYTRVARQLGVSMRTDIHDPIQRANAVLADLTARFAPLAQNTGTTAEALKIMSATIRDLGEQFASQLLAPIGAAANAFNKLSDSTKTFIVETALITTTVAAFAQLSTVITSLSKANAFGSIVSNLSFIANLPLNNIKDLGAAVQLVGTALRGLAVPALFVATLVLVNQANKSWQENEKAIQGAKDAINAYNDASKKAWSTNLGSLGTNVSLTTDLKDVTVELTDTVNQLARKQTEARLAGLTGVADQVKQERDTAQQRLKSVQDYESLRTKLGIDSQIAIDKFVLESENKSAEATLLEWTTTYDRINRNVSIASDDRVKLLKAASNKVLEAEQKVVEEAVKLQVDIGKTRLAAMDDSMAKELALVRINAVAEENTMNQAAKDSADYRKALTEKTAKEERDIRLKYAQQTFDKDIDFALKSSEEQQKFNAELSQAKSILSGVTSANSIAQLSDAEKEILKTEGGRKALDDFRTKGLKTQVDLMVQQEELQKQTAIFSDQMRLAQEKNTLADLQKKDVGDILLTQGKAALDNIQAQKAAQLSLVNDLESKLVAKKKELGIVDDTTIKNDIQTQAKSTLTQAVTLNQNVEVTVTPDTAEIVRTLTETITNRINAALTTFQADVKKFQGVSA